MASRGWGGSVAVALGVAAATAAAALGLGYGLGIIMWPTVTDAAGESAWLASLAWTAWIAATATVFGAVLADRLSAGEQSGTPPRRSTTERDGVYRSAPVGPVATSAWRLVIALTAAIGGLLTVPLVAVPARAAHRPDTYAPQLIAGGYATAGVVAGLLVAIFALSARAVATNVILSASWLWILAVAAVIHGVATGEDLSTAQLAVWRFSGHFINGTISLPGAALMLGSALVIGGAAAWPAARRGDGPVGVAVSGTAGPVLVAVAYFLAAPQLTTVRADQHFSAYLIAPYTVLAGLAGSLLLSALLAQRAQRTVAAIPMARQAPRSTVDGTDDGYATERAHADEPAPDLTPAAAATGKAPLWPDEPGLAESPTESTSPKDQDRS